MKELIEIGRTVYAHWDETKYGGKPIFMFDNPSFHNLDDYDYHTLVNEGAIEDASQIQRPPVYSGDFMQCIEHAHAIIAAEWWQFRLTHGTSVSWKLHEEQLWDIALKKVTAQVVEKNVEQVLTLADFVAQQGTGGYARSHMA